MSTTGLKVCGNCAWLDDRTLTCMWKTEIALPLWVPLDSERRYVSPGYGAGKCMAWTERRRKEVL